MTLVLVVDIPLKRIESNQPIARIYHAACIFQFISNYETELLENRLTRLDSIRLDSIEEQANVFFKELLKFYLLNEVAVSESKTKKNIKK